MAIAIKVMKPGKAGGSSEICAEIISASGEVGVSGISYVQRYCLLVEK